jgi:hypothetical protein
MGFDKSRSWSYAKSLLLTFLYKRTRLCVRPPVATPISPEFNFAFLEYDQSMLLLRGGSESRTFMILRSPFDYTCISYCVKPSQPPGILWDPLLAY